MSEDKEQSQDVLPPAGEPAERQRSAFLLFAWDFLKVFGIAVAIIIPIRWFLFQPFVVTGDSMKPNFHDGNYLIIDELTYRFRPPVRGEVIVLHSPQNEKDFFIKRIIGLPGERIVIAAGRVRIYNQGNPEGMVLDEGYLPNNNLTYGNIDTTLKTDEYFVLGDNRLSSSDSRVWGILKGEEIVGRAVLRIFPVSEFQIFSPPQYYVAQ